MAAETSRPHIDMTCLFTGLFPALRPSPTSVGVRAGRAITFKYATRADIRKAASPTVP